jgi:glycogen debranching enzyme
MDHSPAYDAVLGLRKVSAIAYHIANVRLAARYALAGWNTSRILASDLFSVEDLAFNCIYAAGLRALARLCKQVGDDETEYFAKLADVTEQAIITRCRDENEGIFYSLYSKDEKRARVKTVASLMPLMLETLPAEVAKELVRNHLQHKDFFWTQYPVPSVSASEEQFCPSSNCLHREDGLMGSLRHMINKYQMVWRGPTWINTNWFLVRGLRLHGFEDIADEITASTSQMVEKSGFWEFYNPVTGEGMGAPNFGWSTLVVDMMDSRRLNRSV